MCKSFLISKHFLHFLLQILLHTRNGRIGEFVVKNVDQADINVFEHVY